MGRGRILNEIRVHWALEEAGDNFLKIKAIYEDQVGIYIAIEY